MWSGARTAAGGSALLDTVEQIDPGTDGAAAITAIGAAEIHADRESPANLRGLLDSLWLARR
ncbi:hypothetical protein LNKW23_42480 [Paralimibaculum aggregatum]|uniref:Uncharacterized protein n=1 Tax=Paralimibaculum aggregatum TaxID=3036245 RepID=A0ABQ6LSH7_9RHOB|nr:hypothetical protein LNKW23_42480 [Limibaculum sp. NKW23]